MGIHSNKTEDTSGVAGATGNSGTDFDNSEEYYAKNVIGFDGGIERMTPASGGEDTALLLKVMQEHYTNNSGKKQKPVISVLDKTTGAELIYSVIVVSAEYANKTGDKAVCYFSIMLESTGRNPLNADNYINTLAAARAAANPEEVLRGLYVTSDAFDEFSSNLILETLSNEWGANTSFIDLDGMVVPALDNDIVIGQNIAALAYNALAAHIAISSGSIEDFNISSAKAKALNTRLKLDVNLGQPNTKNAIGQLTRSDFIVQLNAYSTNNVSKSINLDNGVKTVTQAAGFIDAIPENTPIVSTPGLPPVVGVRYHPHIILTDITVKSQTPAMVLLGLVSSLVMINKDMVIAPLLPTPDMESKRSVGGLNILANIENDPKGVGAPIQLLNKKEIPTTDVAFEMINKLFTLAPIVSLDVEIFGQQTTYLSLFVKAAQLSATKDRETARRVIINKASWLTNGIFPKDFDPERIFINNGTIIPMGRWSDKTGNRDIRDVDSAFIATITKDPMKIGRWAMSNMNSNEDPFITKVEMINELMPTAEITNKAVRVTFTNEFIETLQNACIRAGLNPDYRPEIKLAEQNNLSAITNYYAGAGLNNGFGKQFMAANSNPFSITYGHMGNQYGY